MSFRQLTNDSVTAQEDDALLKCMIELAENVPKILRSHMETIFPFCLKVEYSFAKPTSNHITRNVESH